LKIGLDQRALEHERKANERAISVLTDLNMIRIDEEVRRDPSGYAAIKAKLAPKAVTLAAWLTDDAGARDEHDVPRADQARNIAQTLFGEQLAALFDEALRTNVPIAEWLTPSPVLKLRVEHALAMYRDAWAHPHGASQADAAGLTKLLAGYVTSGTLPVADARRLAGETTFVHGFGDLHSTNVLVPEAVFPRPVLVDASLYGSHHWAGDAARLIVDLILRVRGSGAAAMLWQDFEEACLYAGSLCPMARSAAKAAHGADPTEAVDAFITHVVSGLPVLLHVEDLQIPPHTWHWQWHAALAIEFLRQGSGSGVTPPRGVLALTCAAHNLSTATKLLDDLDFSASSDVRSPPCPIP
jgi:hypothetical protein